MSAGPHTLRITGQSNSHDFDESKTIGSDFSTGGDKFLKVNLDKNKRERRVIL